MKIYRAWTNSNHRVQYTMGYFEDRIDAEKVLPQRTAADPDAGVEEIEVIPPLRRSKDVFNKACEKLPDGYTTGIQREKDAGWVFVVDPNGVGIGWQVDDISLAESFERAIDWCKKDDLKTAENRPPADTKNKGQ